MTSVTPNEPESEPSGEAARYPGRRSQESAMAPAYRTLRVARSDEGVLSVVIDAPPMNLIGPELVRDLVTLLSDLESDGDIRVMVLESADPEYFVPHVDLTKVAEYTAEAAKAGGPGDASLGMLWHKLSELPVVTIAKLRGRARGAGSELALACDMRFAARDRIVVTDSRHDRAPADAARGTARVPPWRGAAEHALVSSLTQPREGCDEHDRGPRQRLERDGARRQRRHEA